MAGEIALILITFTLVGIALKLWYNKGIGP